MQNENDDFHFLSIRERPNNTPTDKIYLSLLASEKETLLLPSTLPSPFSNSYLLPPPYEAGGDAPLELMVQYNQHHCI